MKNLTAIIIGVNGQDGNILRNLLESKKYNIIGISRTKNKYSGLDNENDTTNILDKNHVKTLIKKYKPDEIYYLAAYHHSSQDLMPSDTVVFKNSTDVHVNGYFNILDSVAKYSPSTKICYASSCLIYGGSDTKTQNENTLPAPNSIYAMTKLQGMYLGNWFAEKYTLQVINAILYNHESEYRSSNFVSMKIIQGAIDISKGLKNSITLGDLSTQVDRGYAYDYVEAMYQLLQSDKRGDYIISSGQLHTIQDFVEIVFGYFKLDWKKHIKTDKKTIQRKKGTLFGNIKKIQKDIGRKPNTSFKKMIQDIITKKQ